MDTPYTPIPGPPAATPAVPQQGDGVAARRTVERTTSRTRTPGTASADAALAIARDVAAVGRIAAVPTILQVVSRTTGLRFAAVARVTDLDWTACAVYDLVGMGLGPGSPLALETTICNEIREHKTPVVISNVSQDPQFRSHHTPLMYGFQSYVSIPIFRSSGEFFGTLCALDPEPASLDDANLLQTLELFAQLVGAQLETEERLAESGAMLLAAQDQAVLREQFIAVVGHDLRNPLQAISSSAQLLKRTPLDPRAQRVVDTIERSVGRMAELIENVLDFARGRMGGGIPVALEADELLADELLHVINEVRTAHPAFALDIRMAIDEPVRCDRRRIAQLLGNLLANAAAHGRPDEPIEVVALTGGGVFSLAVTNGGEPIPEDKLARLFQPFSRGAQSQPQPGLGLGLYIAAEIAAAHAGTLAVSSTRESGTCFTFEMPLAGR